MNWDHGAINITDEDWRHLRTLEAVLLDQRMTTYATERETFSDLLVMIATGPPAPRREVHTLTAGLRGGRADAFRTWTEAVMGFQWPTNTARIEGIPTGEPVRTISYDNETTALRDLIEDGRGDLETEP